MELNKKILEVQKEIGKISKDKENPYFKSMYFDINSLLDTLLPLLHKHEILLLQPLTSKDGKPYLTTIVSCGEENIFYEVPLPDLMDPQKFGSAVTYYRRYSLQSLFVLQAEDDDANSASEKVESDKSPEPKKKGYKNLDEAIGEDSFRI